MDINALIKMRTFHRTSCLNKNSELCKDIRLNSGTSEQIYGEITIPISIRIYPRLLLLYETWD